MVGCRRGEEIPLASKEVEEMTQSLSDNWVQLHHLWYLPSHAKSCHLSYYEAYA